jgi:hypothetical protein
VKPLASKAGNFSEATRRAISAGGRRKLAGLKPSSGQFHAARKSLRKPGYTAEGNDLIAAIAAGLEAAVRGPRLRRCATKTSCATQGIAICAPCAATSSAPGWSARPGLGVRSVTDALQFPWDVGLPPVSPPTDPDAPGGKPKPRGRRPASITRMAAQAAPAWLCHYLTISGPSETVDAFAARGARRRGHAVAAGLRCHRGRDFCPGGLAASWPQDFERCRLPHPGRAIA